MATRKAKRYNGYDESYVDTEFGDLEGAQDKASARAVQDQYEENESRGAKKSSAGPIVSKKQLADSGYDNLRDYLNAQKGLTRRGESTPRAPQNTPAAKSTTVVEKTTTTAPSQGGSGRGGQGGATAEELEAYGKQRRMDRAKSELMSAKPSSEDTQKGLEIMAGGGGGAALKGIAALAKGLANRKAASSLAEYSIPQLEAARKALPAPQRLLGMKKGGSVKASKMGSVKTAKPSASSASKRGDGIAMRGKTRGKYL